MTHFYLMDLADSQFWKDWGEIIVGIISIIVAAGIAYLVFKKQEKKKELSSRMEVINVLNDKFQGSSDKISISYLGNELTSLYIAVITVTNSGKAPIPARDYESPVTFVVKSGDDVVNLINWDVDNEDKSKLGITYSDESDYEFSGPLLNPGESYVLKVYSTDRPDSHKMKARIVGVSEIIIDKGDKGSSIWRNLFTTSTLAFLCLVGALALPDIYDLLKSSSFQFRLGVVSAIVILYITVMSSFSKNK